MGKITRLDNAAIVITATPVLTTAAYTAADAVGGVLTFADAARVAGGGGYIKDVVIIDDAGQDDDLELWLYNDSITEIGDATTYAQTEAELHTLVAVVLTSTGSGWLPTGTPSASITEVNQRYVCTDTSLYGQLVCRGTPTFAAVDDVTIRVSLLQD